MAERTDTERVGMDDQRAPFPDVDPFQGYVVEFSEDVEYFELKNDN